MFLQAGVLRAQINSIPLYVDLRETSDSLVRVIFPKGLEAEARRTAATVRALQRNHIRSLKPEKVKGISFILKPYTTIPNGFVQLAPMRSEFFLTPMQDNLTLGTLNWTDLLAVHEYRHVQQFYNADVGATRFFHTVSGEIGWLITSFLGTPNWFWEGDAVVYETALTSGGRGRYPGFLKEYRALSKVGIPFTYDMARLGSYEYLSPNHYPLGYMMNTYVRNTTRQDIWSDVFADAASWRVPVLNVSRSLKKRTGKNASATFDSARQYFKAWWQTSDVPPPASMQPQQVTPLYPALISEYRYVHPQPDGSVLALKSTYARTESVVRLKPGSRVEKEIARPGLSVNSWLSANPDWLVWTELRVDPRWTSIDYSVIVAQRTAPDSKPFVVREKTKWFSPALHPAGGGRMVTVEYMPGTAPALVFMTLGSTGLNRVELPEVEFISHTAWDGEDVVFVAKKGQRNALMARRASGEVRALTPWTHHPIANPAPADSVILFVSTFAQTEDVYAVSRTGGRLYRVSYTGTGAAEPRAAADGSVYWSAFNHRGYSVQRLPAGVLIPDPVQIIEPADQPNPINEAARFEGGDMLATVPDETDASPAEPFNRDRGFLNVHSWTLTGSDPEYTATLYFENLLSTLSGTFANSYNQNENAVGTEARLYYSRFYPVIYGSLSRTRFLDPGFVEFISDAGAGLLLPLSHVSRNHIGGLSLFGAVHHANYEIAPGYNGGFFNKPYQYGEMGLVAGRNRRQAHQNPYPGNGVEGEITYRNTLPSSAYLRMKSVTGELKVTLAPGPDNHNLVLTGAFWVEPMSNDLRMVNSFRFARGYARYDADEHWRGSVNYTWPLANFHKQAGALVYANRVRANVFGDFGVNGARPDRYDRSPGATLQRSIGGELILDTWWFRLIPMELVVRRGVRLDEQPGQKTADFIEIGFGVVF